MGSICLRWCRTYPIQILIVVYFKIKREHQEVNEIKLYGLKKKKPQNMGIYENLMCIWTNDWFCFSIENIRSGDTCIITYQLCYLYILTFKTTWTFLSDHILDHLPLLDLSTILQVIMFHSHYTSMHSQLDILRHLLLYVLPHFLSRQNNCALIMINLCFCLTYYITKWFWNK